MYRHDHLFSSIILISLIASRSHTTHTHTPLSVYVFVPWMLTQKGHGISTKSQEPLCCEAVVVLSMCCMFHLTCFAVFCLDREQRTLAVDPDRIPPGRGMKNTTFIYIKMTIWAKHIKVRWTLSLLKWDRRRDSCHLASLAWNDNSRQS